jgi:ABC-type maltose transport system permease subunit
MSPAHQHARRHGIIAKPHQTSLKPWAAPLSKSAIATVSVFNFLGAWNGFLFPLILTLSEGSTVVTAGLMGMGGR